MLKAQVLATVAVVGLSAGLASAQNVTTKKMQLKVADPAKQKVKVVSRSAGVNFPGGPNQPPFGGASLHVYGGGGLDLCYGLPAAGWQDTGPQFKYAAGKTTGQIRQGKLKIKLNGALALPGGPFGTVNAIFRSGASYLRCMKCDSPTRDEDGKYTAKDCADADCDPEPSGCPAASPSGAFLD